MKCLLKFKIRVPYILKHKKSNIVFSKNKSIRSRVTFLCPTSIIKDHEVSRSSDVMEIIAIGLFREKVRSCLERVWIAKGNDRSVATNTEKGRFLSPLGVLSIREGD